MKRGDKVNKDIYGVNRKKTTERINNGKTHFCQEKNYPIRKKRYRSIESIEQALNKGGIL